MKRAFFLLLPAVLLVFLFIAGCDDETNPQFSRIRVYPQCGVAPLQVDCLAIVSGGNESGDPTGGNNNLDIRWDFGDGGSGTTSINYHTYSEPGEYLVVATAEDPDGKTTSISQMVTVIADTLTVRASSDYDDLAVTVADTINFDLWASSCEIDPLEDDDYRNLIFEWQMNDGTDTVFQSRQPAYTFVTTGDYEVTLSVVYPALATTRRDTLAFSVTEAP